MGSPRATQLRRTDFETQLVPDLSLWDTELDRQLGESHLETGNIQLIYNLGETLQRQWLQPYKNKTRSPIRKAESEPRGGSALGPGLAGDWDDSWICADRSHRGAKKLISCSRHSFPPSFL